MLINVYGYMFRIVLMFLIFEIIRIYILLIKFVLDVIFINGFFEYIFCY